MSGFPWYYCISRHKVSNELLIQVTLLFEWAILIKMSTKPNFGYPYLCVTKTATGCHSEFFRLDVINLQLLKIGDIQGRSTNSNMPFQHVEQQAHTKLNQWPGSIEGRDTASTAQVRLFQRLVAGAVLCIPAQGWRQLRLLLLSRRVMVVTAPRAAAALTAGLPMRYEPTKN